MPDEPAPNEPLSTDQILAAEYSALRPERQWQGQTADQLFTEVHSIEEPLSALCISGGGIRSATFGLGAIQGLAGHGIAERSLLEQFDYMSTVSGGGYIGSWLTAWKHREGGLRAVVSRLCGHSKKPSEGEPDPLKHLREYNNYLSPRAGGLSSDMWTLVTTIVRNVLLNWMVLIPLLMSMLTLPRLFLTLHAFPEYLHGDTIFGSVSPPDGCQPEFSSVPYYCASVLSPIADSWVMMLVLVVSLALVTLALFNTLRYLPGIGNRPHDRFDYQLKVLAPLVGAVLAFMTFNSLYYLGDRYSDSPVPVWSVVIRVLAPCGLAWMLFLFVGGGPARDRMRVIFSPLSLAIAAMALGAGLATWYATNELLWNPDEASGISWETLVTVGPPVVLLGYVLSTTVFVGVSSGLLEDDDREWISRATATILLFCIAWAGVCWLVLVAPEWVLDWRAWGTWAFGAAILAAGWVSTRGGSAKTNANPGVGDDKATSRIRSLRSTIAPVLFFGLLMVSLSIITNRLLEWAHHATGTDLRLPALPTKLGEEVRWYDHSAMLERSAPWLVVVFALAFLAFSLVTSRFININTFSLHAMYRDRLVRAYLGASTRDRENKANKFTGLLTSDDMLMGSLDPRLKPLHVVNLTLNLVGGSRLDWQQRKAEGFTVSPLHAGSSGLGYRPSAQYAEGISLGTAVALSGAAASPNMGAFSSPIIGFIMTLFNTRLGAWLGNPGAAGKDSWTKSGPRFALGPMLKEAMSKTSAASKYVYVSDGGHFENLGLYEMVRRRCRYIVVLDSSCDPDFQFKDLGNALRKIRIDLGIPIEFDDEHVQSLRTNRRCAVACIRYSTVDGPCEDGRIVYIKPLLRGNESPDVTSYAAAHDTFPHESTADQMFDESQTESYRMLGLATIDEIAAGWDGGSLASLCAHVETKYLRDDRQGTASAVDPSEQRSNVALRHRR